MAGSDGDGEGTVFLAHAWTSEADRRVTCGPWHWWNVYTSENVAEMQALRASKRWQGCGKWEVLTIEGKRH